jgi:hypothetical protein
MVPIYAARPAAATRQERFPIGRSLDLAVVFQYVNPFIDDKHVLAQPAPADLPQQP